MAKKKVNLFGATEPVGEVVEPVGDRMNTDSLKLIAYENTLQTVAQMRRAQIEYLKTRRQDALMESKRLEAAVDLRLGDLGVKAY